MGSSSRCVAVVRMVEAGAGPDEVAANRELWTQANSEYADEHAYRAWAAEDITWGIFNVPEQQLGVLGDVRGLDVVELGCPITNPDVLDTDWIPQVAARGWLIITRDSMIIQNRNEIAAVRETKAKMVAHRDDRDRARLASGWNRPPWVASQRRRASVL
jgi:hypothetical protein